jgi:2-polyprenyl-3-methyl-5-hydroxy-6-metoxy-1,4-benzoquinol methylase
VFPVLNALTSTFSSPLQGEGRGFESLSAHRAYGRAAGTNSSTFHFFVSDSPCQEKMERSEWLAQRRLTVRDDYTRDAPTYEDDYDPATPMHRRFARLIETCPEGGIVLDAACGTGPYVGMVLEAGRRVTGIDQSAGMLAQAKDRYPAVRFDEVGLQELDADAAFDAAMCLDAIEHVPPEEWPTVLANLQRALRPGAHLYLTVEEVDRKDLDRAFGAREAGLPVALGEDVGDETGGYHYYLDQDRVAGWLADAGFEVVDDAHEWLEGYEYHDLFVRSPANR